MYVASTIDYATTRAAVNRVLDDAQPALDRHQSLTRRASDAPLTDPERLALADACITLAVAFERAAGLWARHRRTGTRHLPLAVSYRANARRFRTAATAAR